MNFSAEMKICEAGPEDVPILAEMLHEAAELMVEAGVDQWKPEMFAEEAVRGYFETRRVFLLTADGHPAGLCTLQCGDPSYWKELDDERYLYLHRLTVRPAYRGTDFGARLLRFAEEEALRQDKLGLRLDCAAHLPKLNAYYQNQGFRFVAERDLNRSVGGRYVNLYQKTF